MLLEKQKGYFITVDGQLCFGKFIGCFGANHNMYEFDIQVDKSKKKSILLTREEVERQVSYGN